MIPHRLVIAAAVMHWVLGGMWYAAFTAPFTRFMGEGRLADLETRSEPLAFAGALLSSIALAYTLAFVLNVRGAATRADALKSAVVVWLGLVAATQTLTVLFEGRHPGLLVLNVGYHLAGMMLIALVIGSRTHRTATLAATDAV